MGGRTTCVVGPFVGWHSALALLALGCCPACAAPPAPRQCRRSLPRLRFPTAQPPGSPSQSSCASPWWGSQDRHNRTIKAIELFHQTHPNITVHLRVRQLPGLLHQNGHPGQRGNLPDLMQQDYATSPSGSATTCSFHRRLRQRQQHQPDRRPQRLDRRGRINDKITP